MADAKPTPTPTNDEQALVGLAMHLDRPSLAQIETRVAPEDFERKGWAAMYQIILDICADGLQPSRSELALRLKAAGCSDADASLESVADAMDSVSDVLDMPRAARLRAHAIREAACCREIADACREVAVMDEFQRSATADVYMACLHEATEYVLARRDDGACRPASELVVEAWANITAGLEGAGAGLSTGIPDLDRETGGWHKGELNILAARPSVGKSALGCACAFKAAWVGTAAAIFSFEMSHGQVLERLASAVCGVPAMHIFHRRLDEYPAGQVQNALERIGKLPLYISDRMDSTPQAVMAQAKSIQAKRPDLGLIVIDYLQLMDSADRKRSDNRQVEVSQISRACKRMARDLDVPVLALSQLSRGLEHEKRAPRLSDLRESGAIEQDADNVFFLHNVDGSDGERRALDLIIAKQRNGPLGRIPLEFDTTHQRIYGKPKPQQAQEGRGE